MILQQNSFKRYSKVKISQKFLDIMSNVQSINCFNTSSENFLTMINMIVKDSTQVIAETAIMNAP
jgi:hypothetical protein